jgi:hypothetical protein
MKRFAVVAFAALCLAAGSSQAAQAAQQPSPPAVATPSPRALALTKRYIAALHIDQSMKPMMQSMLGPMLEQQAKANPNLTDEQRKAVRETLEEFVGGDMMNQVLDRTTPVYATIFSEDELQSLVDFYESPKGQSIVGKMPQMGPAMGKIMVEMMPQIQAQIAKRICEKLGCSAEATKKTTGA